MLFGPVETEDLSVMLFLGGPRQRLQTFLSQVLFKSLSLYDLTLGLHTLMFYLPCF